MNRTLRESSALDWEMSRAGRNKNDVWSPSAGRSFAKFERWSYLHWNAKTICCEWLALVCALQTPMRASFLTRVATCLSRKYASVQLRANHARLILRLYVGLLVSVAITVCTLWTFGSQPITWWLPAPAWHLLHIVNFRFTAYLLTADTNLISACHSAPGVVVFTRMNCQVENCCIKPKLHIP